MRKLLILIASTGVFYLISATNRDTSTSSPYQIENINNVLSSSGGGQCFDVLIDTWCNEFIKFQDIGYSIEKADELASIEAIADYKKCR